MVLLGFIWVAAALVVFTLAWAIYETFVPYSQQERRASRRRYSLAQALDAAGGRERVHEELDGWDSLWTVTLRRRQLLIAAGITYQQYRNKLGRGLGRDELQVLAALNPPVEKIQYSGF